MKVIKNELRILKQEMVTTMEDNKNDFRKIWFYTGNVKRE